MCRRWSLSTSSTMMLAWSSLLLVLGMALPSKMFAIGSVSASVEPALEAAGRGYEAGMVVSPAGPLLRSSPKATDRQSLREISAHARRRRRSAGRWCAEAQLATNDLGLSAAPEKYVAQANGYCYYLSKTGQSCHETCEEQMAGTCDAAGTEYAAESVTRCQHILREFGGLAAGMGVVSQNDRSGCTWSDLGEESKVQVMKKDNLYPFCSEKHNITRSHRLCACTPMFGSIGLYNKTIGECRQADRSQNRTRAGTYSDERECEDECTRDSQCGAFAFVHPWDGNERACIFYSEGHSGDGGNKHVRCYVKAGYLATLGRCKLHDGKSTQISQNTYDSVESCEAACNANDECEAYQVPEAFQPGSPCALFRAGHAGNGQRGQRCYTKAMGGTTGHAA